jgi:CRP/FNR family cyclic AMP-dependent transcriptional regulator
MIINESFLLKGIDFRVIKELAELCHLESYAKDTVLFSKGEDAKNLFIIEEGKVNLLIHNGASLTYELSNPGEVFGWSSMVESGRYTAACVCASGLRAVRIDRDKLNRIFGRYPAEGLKILRRLAGVFSKRLLNAYSDLLDESIKETGYAVGGSVKRV